jgi:proteasome lid subunit RPN8/RPN11
VLSALVLRGEVEANIVRHVRAAWPKEAIGLIGGAPDGQAEVAIPLKNIGGERAFLAEPYGQYQALKHLRDSGLQHLAIYHTHPEGVTEPSRSDIEWGSAWPCAHLVIAVTSISVAGQRPVRMEAWHFGPGSGQFARLPLVVEAPKAD